MEGGSVRPPKSVGGRRIRARTPLAVGPKVGLEGPVEGSMCDTQPLCSELIGRCGHGALALFVTREREYGRREKYRRSARKVGARTKQGSQKRPMQNRYE
ncbi:unnamed protein product [Lasius platythorax]|uniref:Uncharacterized protein n=1 Tax=Lasius platythorax TaxID=488582 RepID=A0AAV2N1Y9_9HYME